MYRSRIFRCLDLQHRPRIYVKSIAYKSTGPKDSQSQLQRLRVKMDTSNGKFMYFGYGSNLLKERLQHKNPSAQFYAIGRLQGYRFDYGYINGRESTGWSGAVATIVNDPANHLFGIVWEIDSKDLKNLNRQESCYNAIQVNVDIVNPSETGSQTLPRIVECRTYQLPEGEGGKLPSPFYKGVIVKGAEQNNLPRQYVDFLRAMPDNERTEPPPVYRTMMDKL